MDPENYQVMALKAAKKELRLLMKLRLSNIPNESIIVQSTQVFNTLTHFKPYQDAKRIGIYLSMPTGEIQTDPLVRHALKDGKQVFVPYLHKAKDPLPDTPRSVMEMVEILSLSDYMSLKRDNWGIPTIGADTVETRESILGGGKNGLDMILMPGVAFDIDPKTGYVRRLGHGKGFYDYFLHRYKKSMDSHEDGTSVSPGTTALLYGLALEEQYLQKDTGDSVPVNEHDNLLHGLVVGDGKLLEGQPRRE